MAYTRLTAAEAAAMIKDQDNIGLSGFTPNGVPKATFRELSKRAIAEHEAGRPFQGGNLTGASTSQSIEGDMAAANAIKFRAPFSTNKDFRTHTHMGEIDYEDMHLGHMAERLRRGFYGEIDLAIIEVSDLEEAKLPARLSSHRLAALCPPSCVSPKRCSSIRIHSIALHLDFCTTCMKLQNAHSANLFQY